MNLRTLRYALLIYVAFDFFFGGIAGGFFTLTPLAAAQFTQVSGTVTDPNGLAYANGTISATLVTSGSPKFTSTNQPYTPPSQPTGLSSAGSFVMQLADNTTLTPGGSTWSFTVNCAAGCVPVSGGKGPVSFTVTGITISGSSQSITATLTAAAPALSFGGSGSGTVSPGTVGLGTAYTGSTTAGPIAGTYYAVPSGLKCDGVTDDTAALNALDTTVYNAGGGTIVFPNATCLIAGHVTLPNDGTGVGLNQYSRQRTLRWTGATFDQGGQGLSPVGGTILLLTYNGSGVAKIETYGLGRFELDHVSLYDNAGDSMPFFFTTGTTINFHDNGWYGSQSGTACNQDAILLGGFAGTFTGLNFPNAAFQGYNSYIQRNYFNRLRRVDYQKTYAGSVAFDHNFIGPSSGSNLTAATLSLTSVAAASGGNTVYTGTITGGAANALATQSVTISGFTNAANNTGGSNPVAFNVVASTTTTITVNNPNGVSETNAGSLVMTAGSAIEFDSTAQTGGGDNENFISENRFEITNYPYAGKFLASNNNYIAGNDFEDASVTSQALWFFDVNSVLNMVLDSSASTLATEYVDNNGTNTFISTVNGQASKFGNNGGITTNGPIKTTAADPASYYLTSTTNSDQYFWQLFHSSQPKIQLWVNPAGGTAEDVFSISRTASHNFTLSVDGSGSTQVFTCLNATSGYCFFQAISGGTVRIGTAAAIDQIDVTAGLISLGSVPLKWQSDGGGTLGASNGGRPSSIFALNQVSSGVSAGSPAYADLTIGYNTAAMTAQSSTTCTNVTGMAWNIAASKRYVLSCEVPITFAASATVQFCLGGPGTATSYALEADGPIGATAAYQQISAVGQTAWSTKTGASGAPGAAEVVHVKANIQNGATASGTALTLQTAANGTNNITVGADAECTLTQAN